MKLGYVIFLVIFAGLAYLQLQAPIERPDDARALLHGRAMIANLH